MQETLIALALKRAGFSSLQAFMKDKGLQSEEAAQEALMPWLLGYDLWRVQPGDTYTKIARELGTSVRAIAAANPGRDPQALPVGTYLVIPLGFPVVPEDVPYTWQLTHYVLRGLQARYPFLQMDIVGYSVYGRPIESVRLGRGKRVVYCNAAHHANEWITVPAVLSCLEQYAQAVAFGEQLLGLDAQALSRETVLHLVPLVNPDGVDLVNGAVTEQEQAEAEAIAEQYPDIAFPDGWKANLRGVDLNLNYPAQWDQAKEIKYGLGFTGPAPRDYVGPEPLSEPESRAMFNTTEQLDPDLVIAWHTQGQEIYWKFLDLQPEGARQLGRQMAIASGYALEDVPMASSSAGYKDWFIQDFDRPGYTVEAGLGENPLPLSQLPEIVRDNLPILLLGLSGGDPDFREPELPVAAYNPPPPQPVPSTQRNPKQLPGGKNSLQTTWG